MSAVRHVLVATVGGQPQIVTFTLDLLLQRALPISEVILLHPQVSNLLLEHSLARLAAEFVNDTYWFQGHPLVCRLRSFVVQPEDTTPNDMLAKESYETISHLFRDLKQTNSYINLCLSGGSKQIALLATSVALLTFDNFDHIWHVYIPDEVKARINDETVMHVSPQDGVRLIEIPFVPFGAYLPSSQQSSPIESRSNDFPPINTVRVEIMEKPLTAQSLASVFTIFTELHTKCTLIQRGRFPDLIEYNQTHSGRFVKEANLVIAKLSYNSPALIDFLVSSSGGVAGAAILAFALKTGIDAIIQTPLRFKAKALENQKKELELRISEQEAQYLIEDKKQKADLENKEKLQAQHIALEKAELERQKILLEIATQQLDIKKQQLEIQEISLELEKNRLEIAIETASNMVDILRPGIDATTKGMLVQPLIPTLLQFNNIEGLELDLLAYQVNPEDTTKDKS